MYLMNAYLTDIFNSKEEHTLRRIPLLNNFKFTYHLQGENREYFKILGIFIQKHTFQRQLPSFHSVLSFHFPFWFVDV